MAQTTARASLAAHGWGPLSARGHIITLRTESKQHYSCLLRWAAITLNPQLCIVALISLPWTATLHCYSALWLNIPSLHRYSVPLL